MFWRFGMKTILKGWWTPWDVFSVQATFTTNASSNRDCASTNPIKEDTLEQAGPRYDKNMINGLKRGQPNKPDRVDFGGCTG